MPNKRAFWVLTRQPNEISKFARRPVPAKFKTVEEAKQYCRELNLRKGAYHPGYYIEERIGDKPVNTSKKVDEAED